MQVIVMERTCFLLWTRGTTKPGSLQAKRMCDGTDKRERNLKKEEVTEKRGNSKRVRGGIRERRILRKGGTDKRERKSGEKDINTAK